MEVGNAAFDSLDRMRDESKKATLKLVDMECSYLTVDFFRKLPQDIEKGGNPTHSIFDRYNDSYLRRIGNYSPCFGSFLWVEQKSLSFWLLGTVACYAFDLTKTCIRLNCSLAIFYVVFVTPRFCMESPLSLNPKFLFSFYFFYVESSKHMTGIVFLLLECFTH